MKARESKTGAKVRARGETAGRPARGRGARARLGSATGRKREVSAQALSLENWDAAG